MDIVIRRIALARIIDLRHQVLREGLPREMAYFEGDESPHSRHYGGLDGDALAGCATLHASHWENRPAWQLRGMAVADSHRSRGVGTALLRFIDTELSTAPTPTLWCNARIGAISFYQKLGWVITSPLFDIPTAGPHYRMVKG